MTFEDAWVAGLTIPSAYYEEEGRALFAAAAAVPSGALLEIGCDYGRSCCLIADANVHGPLILIDPFLESGARWRCLEELCQRRRTFTLYPLRTADVSLASLPPLAFVHIDGDHVLASLLADCRLLPLVLPGGVLAVHDYRRESLPVVTQVIDHMTRVGWEHLQVAGYLGLWRRVV